MNVFDEKEVDGDLNIDFVPVKITEDEKGRAIFVDFKIDGKIESQEWPPNDPENVRVISPIDVFTKDFILDKELLYEDDIKKEFIEMAKILADRNIERDKDLYEKFNFSNDDTLSEEENKKRLKTKITNAMHLVAAEGRIGISNMMIISENNYEDMKDLLKHPVTPLFCDIDDIIMYRKNTIDQPGVILIHNNEKYKLVDIGFYPEKQFIKIKLT